MANSYVFFEKVESTFIGLSASEWISIVSLIVNSILAYWIVYSIQKNQTKRRVLKDLLISEIKEIREEYRVFIKDMVAGKITPRHVLNGFKAINVKLHPVMFDISKLYRVDLLKLSPYQWELLSLIANHQDFIMNFNNSNWVVSDGLKQEIDKFESKNDHLFLEVMITINNF